jgi:mono/diheme cytochrome c family protein
MTDRLHWLSLIALAALLISALVACGGGGEQSPAGGGEAAQAPAGDPAAGQEVFLNVGGCGACHTIQGVEGANGQVGPELTHIATIAQDLAPEAGVADAQAYIRQSILEPNAYVVEDCPTGACVPGTMPQNFGELLSDKQLNDVIAFLMQQK